MCSCFFVENIQIVKENLSTFFLIDREIERILECLASLSFAIVAFFSLIDFKVLQL
jgi:hypothetical protein